MGPGQLTVEAGRAEQMIPAESELLGKGFREVPSDTGPQELAHKQYTKREIPGDADAFNGSTASVVLMWRD